MTNPAGVTVEGNLSELDTDAKFFKLEDRTGKTFIKVFWRPAHEDKMRKQKVGYYEAPVVTREENTGGLQEAILVDLPYKPRPDNFPRMQQKKGIPGAWQPKKPRVTISATINLQNYENIKVEVEGNSAEECTKILIDTLNGFATRKEYAATRELIQGYTARVLNGGA